MPYPVRDMRRALMNKLECEETEGRRHTKYRVYREDRIIAATGISHGATELTDALVSRMACELCVESRVLKGICRCPYGWEEYLEHYNPDLNPHRRRGRL
jgi:hypothetical protein